LTPDRRTLFALFSLAFGLRILFGAVFGTTPQFSAVHDTYGMQIAERLARDWHLLATPFTPNAPGYITLLAAVFTVFGVSWWSAMALNATLAGLTTFFLYRIGEKRIGPRAGLYAAVWFALSAHLIVFTSFATRDTLVTLLFTWLVYNMVMPFRRMRNALWIAFLYTLLIMTEPLFLVLLPVLIIHLARFTTRHRVLSLQYLFLFLAFLIFFNLPWTIRNYVVHGGFIPVSIEAERYTSPVTRLLLHPTPTPEVLVPPGAVAGEPGFLDNTREFWRVVRIADAPAVPSRGIVAQPAWSLRHNLASLSTYGVLLPFFLAGVAFAIARRNRAMLIACGAILCYAFVRGFMTGDDRPRLVIEPLLILVAVYGLRELWKLRAGAGGETPAG
jgi:4-amino-4-deoxy-L-arabinose transferase-like glycosyltransferase